MSETHRTNIGQSLLCIHRCITRGIEVSSERSREYARSGYPDEATRGGFASYVRSLATVLDAHHLAEDELAFPTFKSIFPQVPYQALMDDHRKITALITTINQVLDRPGPDGESQADLNRELSALEALWRPHIQIEESHFTPQAVDERISLEDQIKLAGQIGAHNQKYAVPDYLTVPFTLFNLAEEDRAYMAAEMPPILTQQLVPQVWKDKWAPMIPFFLPV
jgi:hemerythrin-like domain-containing protein